MRMILTCLCLLDGIAAVCMSDMSCTASSSVAFDCDSHVTSSGSKHCCCANSNDFCDRLSDCNAALAVYPDEQCWWKRYWTGDTETFPLAQRYSKKMNGAHNFIDVQVRSTDAVSAYLARGSNCDIFAGDSGFSYLSGHKLLSDSSSAGWRFDTGDWPANTYCIQLDCNNMYYSCTAEVSASFRECWDVSSPPPPTPLSSPPPPTPLTASGSSWAPAPSRASPPPDACGTVLSECQESTCAGKTVVTNSCYISRGITVSQCTCSRYSTTTTTSSDSASDSSSSSSSSSTGVIVGAILVALFGLGALVAIAIAVYCYSMKKRVRRSPLFRHLAIP